jgi:hypothetical protein
MGGGVVVAGVVGIVVVVVVGCGVVVGGGVVTGFMPRTPLSPKHSAPLGALMAEHVEI